MSKKIRVILNTISQICLICASICCVVVFIKNKVFVYLALSVALLMIALADVMFDIYNEKIKYLLKKQTEINIDILKDNIDLFKSVLDLQQLAYKSKELNDEEIDKKIAEIMRWVDEKGI